MAQENSMKKKVSKTQGIIILFLTGVILFIALSHVIFPTPFDASAYILDRLEASREEIHSHNNYADQDQEPTPDNNLEQETEWVWRQEHISGTADLWYDGIFELPINGATGFASIPLNLYTDPSINADTIMTLSPGQGFTILFEYDDWWFIAFDENEGFVLHETCFINLPDVLPSIVYNITNSYSSILRTSGQDIPNITGEMLYDVMSYNARLGRYEYTVPALYLTAQKLASVQEAALANGNTLIVYEAFRPRETQQEIVYHFSNLVNTDQYVQDGLGGWGISAFISTSISNHQRGGAIDATLAHVISHEVGRSGYYSFITTTHYSEHVMPSPVHELSARSIVFTHRVNTSSETDWRTATLADTMTDSARLLQSYFTNAGFTPLASEWWHFNDLSSLRTVRPHGLTGEFFISSNYSIPPN